MPTPPGRVQGINHITLSVHDLDAALAFYVDSLGCKLLARWPTGAYLLAGNLWLALVTGENYGHIAFAVDDFPALKARLAESAEQWQKNWTEGDSHYFRDPSGNQLEIHATSLIDRLESALASPWEGLVIEPDALEAARKAGR